MSQPDCPSWSDCGIHGGGCCALNLFGARPSLGTCDGCEHNAARGAMAALTIKGETIPARVLTPAELAASRAQRDVITRALWDELHARPLIANLVTDAGEGDELAWLATWLARVPCGQCRAHWVDWKSANPPKLKSSRAYFEWGWAAHDEVNRIRGVARMTLAAAAELHGFAPLIAANAGLNGLRAADKAASK